MVNLCIFGRIKLLEVRWLQGLGSWKIVRTLTLDPTKARDHRLRKELESYLVSAQASGYLHTTDWFTLGGSVSKTRQEDEEHCEY